MDDALELAHRESLAERREGGTRLIKRGIVLVGLVPVVFFATLLFDMWVGGPLARKLLLAGLLYPFVGGGTGVGLIAIGASRRTVVAKELKVLDERRQLPAARVIER